MIIHIYKFRTDAGKIKHPQGRSNLPALRMFGFVS